MTRRARLLLVPLALLVVAAAWTPLRSTVVDTVDQAASCAIECTVPGVGQVADRAGELGADTCLRSADCAGAAAFGFGLALAVVVVASVQRPRPTVAVRVAPSARVRPGREPAGGIYRPPRPLA